MAEQVQKQRQASQTTTEVEELPAIPEQADLSKTDELLDEIDEALNALDQDLAQQYTQKGGE